MTKPVEGGDEVSRQSLVMYCNNTACQLGPSWSRSILKPTKTGRPALYCCGPCRQADYRARKEIADREEARRIEAQRLALAWDRLVNDITIELAAIKMPTTVRKATAERIARRISEQRAF